MPTPEQQARTRIDALLEAAGWSVQGANAANIHAARGVAIREFPLSSPSPRTRGEGGGEGLSADGGYADYLLYAVHRGNLTDQTLKPAQALRQAMLARTVAA